MKNYFIPLIPVICLLLSSGISARDINLDEIYIKKNSSFHKKLSLEKLEVYQKAGAVFIDKNIIFAGWISGDDIIYVKENNTLKTNYIYKYSYINRNALRIARLKGVITIVKLSSNGRYLVLKRLVRGNSIIPHGEMVIINLGSGKFIRKITSHAFLDFSIPFEGNSILYENKAGITEFFIDTGFERILLKKQKYSDITDSNNPSIAYVSPDRKKVLILNGSGGNYKGKLLSGNKVKYIEGISSSSEVSWLNNFTLVYRTGYAGNYSVLLYNLNTDKIRSLMKHSLNTNISFSVYFGNLSFLKEQIVFFYDIAEGKITNTGLEGEDISFAPNGRFVSLLSKRLFVVNPDLLEKRRIELRRSWKSILRIYSDLQNKKSEFENSYSKSYITRKIQIYDELINGNY